MLSERFWNKVDKSGPNGCWTWLGQVNNKGYGMTSVRYLGFKNKKLAHRMSYLSANGRLDDALFVLHSCDNPKCVNPSHLRQGTQKDNVQDAISRNRHSTPPRNDGVNHWMSKADESEVLAIRQAKARGEKVKDIADRMGLSRWVVGRIALGKTYHDV